jgi:hypothetical protein
MCLIVTANKEQEKEVKKEMNEKQKDKVANKKPLIQELN